jgi:prolyl 4-hydroxylase
VRDFILHGAFVLYYAKLMYIVCIIMIYSMQNYTTIGFLKTRAPAKVMELATTFWEQNHYNQEIENWPLGNTYINSWVSPTYMLKIEDGRLRGGGKNLRKHIWDEAREAIEDWTGEDLSPTSLYGIRVYCEGAILLPHVDRLPLVASAMINIAQDVDEDWPMEIYDHDGKAHNITLEPGDMLLFESHSVIHGRPFPLKGRHYAMLFIHFEPTGHSLKHDIDGSSISVDDQYKQAAKENQGGQSASYDTLPPYIIRESPEEIHWKSQHPEGWHIPEFNPLKRSSDSELHKAAEDGDVELIKRALEEGGHDKHGAPVIASRDDEGWQLLHSGAAQGHKEVVELLIEHGADLNSRTHGGHGATPLYIAEKNNGSYHPVVRYLKSLGALNLGPEL